MIAIINYKSGNLTSVRTALTEIGVHHTVTSNPQDVLHADKVIFPGVGEARQTMEELSATGLQDAIREFISSGKPLLGICMGCQILLEYSEERDTKLLGVIPGKVRRFSDKAGLKVPQIGWNTIRHDGTALFNNIDQDSSFYFVHSYFIEPSEHMCALAEYGIEYAAAVQKDNVWGTQFHPEKSGRKGLSLLNNFAQMVE